MAATATNVVVRPTFAIGGQDRPALASGLLTLSVSERMDGLYRCETTFGNWGDKQGALDYLYFDRAVLEFGKAFVVKVGSATVFDGAVTALEGQFPSGRGPEVTVLAEDRLQDLRMTRRTRTFENISDADLMRRIAGDHGLTPSIDLSGPTHKVLAQVDQSDLAFLRERARAIGAELWVDGRTLNAKPRASRQGTTVALAYRVELTTFSAVADLAHQRTSLTVSGWDVSGKAAITHEASDSVVSGELEGGSSGATVLRGAFGERKESVAHGVPMTAQEAQNAAEAAYRLRARRFVAGHGTVLGAAGVRVGGIVDLRGLGPLFSGKYYVTEVQVLYDGAGLRTEFFAERPGLGR
jgi:hypothetical protein